MKKMFHIVIITIMLCINYAQFNLFSGRVVMPDAHDYSEIFFSCGDFDRSNSLSNIGNNEVTFKDIYALQKPFSLKSGCRSSSKITFFKSDLISNQVTGAIPGILKSFSAYRISSDLCFLGRDFSFLQVIRI